VRLVWLREAGNGLQWIANRLGVSLGSNFEPVPSSGQPDRLSKGLRIDGPGQQCNKALTYGDSVFSKPLPFEKRYAATKEVATVQMYDDSPGQFH
jgi:hypothetical protein